MPRSHSSRYTFPLLKIAWNFKMTDFAACNFRIAPILILLLFYATFTLISYICESPILKNIVEVGWAITKMLIFFEHMVHTIQTIQFRLFDEITISLKFASISNLLQIATICSHLHLCLDHIFMFTKFSLRKNAVTGVIKGRLANMREVFSLVSFKQWQSFWHAQCLHPILRNVKNYLQ